MIAQIITIMVVAAAHCNVLQILDLFFSAKSSSASQQTMVGATMLTATTNPWMKDML